MESIELEVLACCSFCILIPVQRGATLPFVKGCPDNNLPSTPTIGITHLLNFIFTYWEFYLALEHIFIEFTSPRYRVIVFMNSNNPAVLSWKSSRLVNFLSTRFPEMF